MPSLVLSIDAPPAVADTLNRIPGFQNARSEASVGRKEVRLEFQREDQRILE